MGNKSFAGIMVFGLIAFIGANIMGDVQQILTATQRLGLSIVYLGIMSTGACLGWLLRSEQPDLKKPQTSEKTGDANAGTQHS